MPRRDAHGQGRRTPGGLKKGIGSSGAANARAGEEYQIRALYQVKANSLIFQVTRSSGVAIILLNWFGTRLKEAAPT